MNVLILGGDGFCGWPTALKFADHGCRVFIVDNGVRRRIDDELGTNSLTPISSLRERVEIAKDEFGYAIEHVNIDVATEYDRFVEYLETLSDQGTPITTIVHFAEQRAAPYSMIDADHRMYTVNNNIAATHNVLNAIVQHNRNIHLVHLGTMGVYGYNKQFGKIPEGYLDVTVDSTNQSASILYPTDPGSVYHMTKSLDQILFQFYVKNWQLKITDLHQGIVWGTETSLTKKHPAFINRFDYDGCYGTVLNRFIVQAAAGYPLTVYGKGQQTRAFIHIEDTTNCVYLAAINFVEGDWSRTRIFNQVAETATLVDLAGMLSEQYGATIRHVPNPRKEAERNDLEVHNTGLKALGFKPIALQESLIDDVHFVADMFKSNFNENVVLNSPKW